MVGSLTRSNMTLDLVGQRRRRRASGLTVAALSLGEGQSDSCCSLHRRVTLGWCRLKVRRGWWRYVGLSEDMFIRLINVVVKACDGPTFHTPRCCRVTAEAEGSNIEEVVIWRWRCLVVVHGFVIFDVVGWNFVVVRSGSFYNASQAFSGVVVVE
jgi:hypothetical protein